MNEFINQELSIELLKARDSAEFTRLLDLHSVKIYRLALKMVGNQQDAEDILQNTFLKVMDKIDSFEGRSSLLTWIYRIAANEALMLIRKNKREFSFLDSEGDGDIEDILPTQFIDWCCLPESEFMTVEAKSYLDEAIRQLPDTLRIVFILRDIEGLSIRETSEALNLTETAVKTRLLRARLRLRESLSEYYGGRFNKEMEK